MKTGKGMEQVNELYENRAARAKEIKKEGGQIIGYFCCYTPVEIITALDLVPYRIQGNVREPITEADAYLETITCSFVRSCFDQALKGAYEFLDGLVVPHTCDTIHRIYDIWLAYRRLPYTHFINVPHMIDPSSFEFFRNELEQFKRSLERFAKKEMTQQDLGAAVEIHNENRILLRELYQLRKPPLVSGTDVLRVLIVGMGIPVNEHNDLLREVIREVKAHDPLPGLPRILVYGAEIDDVGIVQLVEDSGGQVVMDDVCTGSRTFWYDSNTDGDALTRLARRYLDAIPCPRTYRPQQNCKHANNRFKYILDLVREFNVQGVIAYVFSYCDTHELDVPSLKDYLKANSVPVLCLSGDYVSFSKAQLQTRIQAFLEIVA